MKMLLIAVLTFGSVSLLANDYTIKYAAKFENPDDESITIKSPYIVDNGERLPLYIKSANSLCKRLGASKMVHAEGFALGSNHLRFAFFNKKEEIIPTQPYSDGGSEAAIFFISTLICL